MKVEHLVPILNVSDIQQSFAWFERLGWEKGWDWAADPGGPVTFGGVRSGKCEIFLCQGAQGGRGRGTAKRTFGSDGDQTGDKGVWVSLFVDDVERVHRRCQEQGLEITFPPTDMSWGLREFHLRHPDGHVFRIGQGLEEEEDE